MPSEINLVPEDCQGVSRRRRDYDSHPVLNLADWIWLGAHGGNMNIRDSAQLQLDKSSRAKLIEGFELRLPIRVDDGYEVTHGYVLMNPSEFVLPQPWLTTTKVYVHSPLNLIFVPNLINPKDPPHELPAPRPN
jgi:hypothetical protein